ncbi:MAG TPA: hypothetical protein ENN21_01395, partial [Spirochaetes bacterium]|nr:hypothetical protein [Spirochaetota bacterium]
MRRLFIFKYISVIIQWSGMREPGYIKKHLHYINYRVDQIAPCLTRDDGKTDSAALFSTIRYLSGGDALPPDREPDVRHSLDDLKRLVDRWDIAADGDLLGYIYQRLKTARSKKILGQYFTPPDIVDYICKQTLKTDGDLRTMKVLDPSCGSGQFLIAAFRVFAESYARQGVPAREAARRIIADNLCGYDLDPVAVYICHFNLMRISGVKDYKIYNIHELNY